MSRRRDRVKETNGENYSKDLKDLMRVPVRSLFRDPFIDASQTTPASRPRI